MVKRQLPIMQFVAFTTKNTTSEASVCFRGCILAIKRGTIRYSNCTSGRTAIEKETKNKRSAVSKTFRPLTVCVPSYDMIAVTKE